MLERNGLELTVFAVKRERIRKELVDNALFFRFVNFQLIGRHFITSSAINDIYFFCAETHSRAACIHGGIAAAADGDFFADSRCIALNNGSEEVNAAVYAL